MVRKESKMGKIRKEIKMVRRCLMSQMVFGTLICSWVITSFVYGGSTTATGYEKLGSYENVSAQLQTRYRPVENGYQIIGSREMFNRPLYGGHKNDNLKERYFTYAGDLPIVMGATYPMGGRGGRNIKTGTFMAGVAMTPGFSNVRDSAGDLVSQWFHDTMGTVSTFRNGWMEYEIQPHFQHLDQVKVSMKVLPLMPEDGFLVHIKATCEQRILLGMAFGGVGPQGASFSFAANPTRYFKPEDCKGNKVTCGKDRALVEGSGTRMWVGTNLPVEVSVGDAKKIKWLGEFLSRKVDPGDTPIARMLFVIEQARPLEGFIVLIRNEDEKVLDRWLAKKDPVAELKEATYRKQASLKVKTPDQMFDLTIPANVIAQDAIYHRPVFVHGVTSWHDTYLGWRTMYGPTVMGWHDRVDLAARTHVSTMRINDNYDDAYFQCMLGREGMSYNMQEVGIDMFLHHIEWTNDFDFARYMFEPIRKALRYEQRLFDPDGNGLYRNYLNTWVSDSHTYNGGECTQASAYNYRANRLAAIIAEKLNKDPKEFASRANNIKKALNDTLWLPDKGLMAEYKDILGNKLVHPSPELATIYHAIECDVVDDFQAYQMLRFTETDLRNERTLPRRGRLVWNTNWYPVFYSSCGIYPAENIHLAWAYFQNGQTEKAMDIMRAIVDGHFLGKNPGLVAHSMHPSGFNCACKDFTDIVSMYIRTVVEGVFGVRFRLLENRIDISPNIPEYWDHASVEVEDISLDYRRQCNDEGLNVSCEKPAMRVISLPMRATTVNEVKLNGKPAKYRIEPGINRSMVVLQTEQTGELDVRISSGAGRLPVIESPENVLENGAIQIQVSTGEILEYKDPSGALSDISVSGQRLKGKATGSPGWHTVFLRVGKDQWQGWLAADFEVIARPKAKRPEPQGEFHPIDISKYFNMSLTKIHQQRYLNPRAKGLIHPFRGTATRQSGREWSDFNQRGDDRVANLIDDSTLRNSGGIFTTPSGIPFKTPDQGNNVVCVSIWDNYPEEITMPLSGRATELAILFMASSNPMQTAVEITRYTVEYADGPSEVVSLYHCKNLDDWLNSSFQKENETVYFNDYNHGIVQRITLDPKRPLKALKVRAIANEAITGIIGISLRKE